MKKLIQKIFGGITITWPKLIIFAIIMGVWTALMAMFVPDGNSFHDIAATGEGYSFKYYYDKDQDMVIVEPGEYQP